MGKITGFMEIPREGWPERPIPERIHDWKEIYQEFPEEKLRAQGARCMDCGIPFCNQGCPLGNYIPEWNDLVYKNQWREAIDRLHATNNFPEFTGMLCPAPCEGACVLGINDKPVTIKYIEFHIIDHAFREGWVLPQPPKALTGKKVAVIGSGPAGLACAQQLARVGHEVVVFEKDDRLGGLLRYGIPDFKMAKERIDLRIEQMKTEGVKFRPGVDMGKDISLSTLRQDFQAVALCMGAMLPRNLNVPGRDLKGVYLAMDYLTEQNRINAGDQIKNPVTAKDKKVIILGGGDTGADCLGTAHRQGAASIHQLEIMPRPPDQRDLHNPWPQWPMIFRTSPAHAEGGLRDYCVMTKKLSGENGILKKLHAVRLELAPNPNGGSPKPQEMPESNFDIDVDLLLLAMGFTGPVKKGLVEDLGCQLDQRGNIAIDENYMTSVPGFFSAGDSHRGASLIVWAIAEGRKCARGIDKYLMGETELP